ncbi:hypothetical protein ASPBRDRAFT_337247 [Aspergillus brasiliensis CBS 101740]|uniref:Uncharacterized protein n=1 Tax=Aspergillus brasiliensis (strain CBS 101740 / IMI 381727 / IBT 21946) TaxID=767769 RepID=A0A1L9U6I9_ASPBC|nr:hypothetical protein ASPBRDRAFT_337247 [Aspergillus brasiliensis CBS 101740]
MYVMRSIESDGVTVIQARIFPPLAFSLSDPEATRLLRPDDVSHIAHPSGKFGTPSGQSMIGARGPASSTERPRRTVQDMNFPIGLRNDRQSVVRVPFSLAPCINS